MFLTCSFSSNYERKYFEGRGMCLTEVSLAYAYRTDCSSRNSLNQGPLLSPPDGPKRRVWRSSREGVLEASDEREFSCFLI